MKPPILSILFASLALCVSVARAQVQPLEQRSIELNVDSGYVQNDGVERGVVFSHLVRDPEATWLRLRFRRASLGAAAAGGKPTILRLTSLLDGAVQTLDAEHLLQWRFTSAYFNGNMVLVEVIADPGAGTSRVQIVDGWAGVPGGDRTICGPDDDRLPSSDPRVARVVPIGCSAWLFDDANRTLLTAGHCAGSDMQVAEFNVPLSNSSGNIQHPHPDHQYPIDTSSVQETASGVGNDWAYFGCFPNSNTLLTPAQAQGDWFALAAPPAPGGQTIRITGFGTMPSPPEWNQAQKTHTGPYMTFSGTRVTYQTDTTGGNSGSPVIREDTGEAIGIHTHGGCTSGGGANQGTASTHNGLQNALANPQGVCVPVPTLDFNFPNGLSGLIDPSGAVLRVEVIGRAGGTPQQGTGALHYTIGGPEIDLPMTEVAPNIYDAVFPAFDCGTRVDYYFSAETTDSDVVTSPANAPLSMHSGVVGDAFAFGFDDDFENDLGWTVTNSGGLSAGTWERGTPMGLGDRGDPYRDADGSGQCFLTDPADGDTDVDGGSTTLTSPTMDATIGDAHITYHRWFSNSSGNNGGQDPFVIEVSDDDGATWAGLETVGPAGAEVDGGWYHKSFRVADFVSPTDQFRIRFIASDTGAASIVEAAIDGVRMNHSATGVTCCPADLNDDGQVDVLDLLDMLHAWGSNPGHAADLDGDGNVNVLDLLVMLSAWGAC